MLITLRQVNSQKAIIHQFDIGGSPVGPRLGVAAGGINHGQTHWDCIHEELASAS